MNFTLSAHVSELTEREKKKDLISFFFLSFKGILLLSFHVQHICRTRLEKKR